MRFYSNGTALPAASERGRKFNGKAGAQPERYGFIVKRVHNKRKANRQKKCDRLLICFELKTCMPTVHGPSRPLSSELPFFRGEIQPPRTRIGSFFYFFTILI